MARHVMVAGCAALLMATSLAIPAQAGNWDHRPGVVVIYHDARPGVPWHQQPPVAGTGPAHYYSRHPHHLPGYPRRLSGYPVPVFAAPRPLPGAVVHVLPGLPAAHVAWCAGRFRSYDVHSNTFQPYHGPRRACRSPYW